MTTALAVLALLGVAVAVIALVALHVVPSGLSPLRDPVSAYGIIARRPSRPRWPPSPSRERSSPPASRQPSLA